MKIKQGRLLRIYLGENDHLDGLPLHQWIVKKAHESGLKGATVLRGLEGFGARGRIHTTKILRLSDNLPLVVEIVDEEEVITQFLKQHETLLNQGLVTLEKVDLLEPE